MRKIGVDHAIDYEKSNFVDVVHKFAPDGIEMVMDPIGGKSFAAATNAWDPPGGWWCTAFPPLPAGRQEEARCAGCARCCRRRDFIR